MNDNTTQHGDHLFQMDGGVVAMVREGMTVRDAAGAGLGTVERVKMGDPEAITTDGNVAPQSGGFVADVLTAMFGDIDVPEPKRSQLLRYGFIRVDGAGLTDTDRFVRGDKIQQVQGEYGHTGSDQRRATHRAIAGSTTRCHASVGAVRNICR